MDPRLKTGKGSEYQRDQPRELRKHKSSVDISLSSWRRYGLLTSAYWRVFEWTIRINPFTQTSKMVWECEQNLQLLSSENRVTIDWVPEHSRLEGI